MYDFFPFFNFSCNEQNMEKLHQKEMEKAARKAKEEYLREHPECAEANNNDNFTNLLNNVKKGMYQNSCFPLA